MSDDSHNPSHTPAGGDAAADLADSVRLAVVARSQEAANALWSAIDERSRGRNRPARIHADRSDADAIVYLPDEQDFASDAAAQSFETRLALDPASSKVVFEPETLADPMAQARLEALRDRIGAQSDSMVWIATRPPDAGEGREPRGNAVQLQARRIERILKSRARPASIRAKGKRPERTRKPGRDKGARREARAERIKQRKVSGSENRKSRSPEAGERRKRRAPAQPVASPQAKPSRKVRPGDAPPAEKRAVKPAHPKAAKSAPLPFISISIAGMEGASKVQLMEALKRAFRESGARAVEAKPQAQAHIAVRSFGDDPFDDGDLGLRAQSLLEDKAHLRMFLGQASGGGAGKAGAGDRTIARISLLCRGAFIDLESHFRRYRPDTSPEVKPDATDPDLTAGLIVREAINRRIRNLPLVRNPTVSAPDLADAYALAARPTDLVSNLTWNAPTPPKLLHAVYSAAEVEAFANAMAASREDEGQTDQIDRLTPSEKRAAARLLGLGSLIAPLSYWYAKASERKSGEIAKIDAVLKARGVTASALLERAARLILDFSEKAPLQHGSQAWQEGPVCDRIRVSLLYVLCCRLAAKRRIKFDEASCGAVFRSLVDHIEFLRSWLPYQPASMDGVERDCLLAAAGLALQQTSYGKVLLRDSLERLKKLQLDVGLSGDGVWRGAPFATHCAVLSLLTTLLGDLAAANSDSIDPLAEAVRRMTLFVDALLKSNGEPLPIDATPKRSFAATLAGARRMLALVGARPVKGKPARGMAANRITETYVFRDAQYFVSHSTPKVTSESSQVAFHADPGSPARKDPGGLKLAFAHGPVDLLVGAVPRRKELSGTEPAAFDPALRNGYRVASDAGSEVNAGRSAGKAAIVKSWRGTGWAAARGIEGAHDQIGIARVVVHLKAHHALLVVDAFDGPAAETVVLEQFWHVAPSLAPASASEVPLRFSAGDGVHLAMAFDNGLEAGVVVDRDAFSSCVRRRLRIGTRRVATLFQHTNAAAPLSVSFLRDRTDDWIVAISGAGFAARVTLNSNELRLDEEPQPAV